MLNDHFWIIADITINKAINDNTDDNSPNTDNDNFTSLLTQAYSKDYLPMYSTPCTAQEIENTINALKAKDSGGDEEISMWILKLSSSFIILFTVVPCILIL
jgi:hypothetical protein